jgi:hypothetical protein
MTGHINFKEFMTNGYIFPYYNNYFVAGLFEDVRLFTKKIQQDATLYQIFISYSYEAQHVLGDTSHIIRSLKLH